MDIDQIILALNDAKNRGIKTASVVVNSSVESFCQINIIEITVSDITGCTFYVNGYNKGFIGFVKKKPK